MAQLTRDQVNTILKNAPAGLDKTTILDGLIKSGHELEGVDTNQAKAEMQARGNYIPQAKTEEPTSTYGSRLADSYSKAGERITSGIKTAQSEFNKGTENVDPNTGIITPSGILQSGKAIVRGVGRVLGTVAGATAEPLLQTEPVQNAMNTVGKTAMSIEPVQSITQKVSALSQKYPEISKDLEDIVNIATVGTGKTLEKPVANIVKNTADELSSGVIATGKNMIKSGGKVAESVIPKSEEIMNKVARLKPTDATKFEKLAGKTHGEYLRDTGNFGTPEEIIKKEAEKFTQSFKSVDEALSKLPGTYQDGAIQDALQGLKEKAVATSSSNVKSPILSQITELENKYNANGLTMSEINDVKRLYEKNVKLGYNKLMNADKVEQATNIDNAVRNWQTKKAAELGFENISELNKQTQLSKFIVDKLGDQVVGKNGLNNVSLTDWIMLSGGEPTSVGGFLTKKLLSSKKLQAKAAELLNNSEKKDFIKPKITQTKLK